MEQKITYEGMFLLDASQPNFETAVAPIKSVMERTEADVLALKPWEERRLAYEIEGRKRGLYVLSYFKLDPLRVAELEHECQLNEEILRIMVLRKDNLTEEELNADTPASLASVQVAESRPRKDDDADDADDVDDVDVLDEDDN